MADLRLSMKLWNENGTAKEIWVNQNKHTLLPLMEMELQLKEDIMSLDPLDRA